MITFWGPSLAALNIVGPQATSSASAAGVAGDRALGDDLADDDAAPARRARARAAISASSSRRPAIGAAVGARGVLDDGNRRRGGEPRLDQPRGDLAGDGAAHIDGDGRARAARGRPSRAASRRRRHGRSRRPATSDVSRSVSGISFSAAAAKAAVMPGTMSKETPAGAQRRHLLAGPAEDQRIAGLQPDDAAAVPRLADEERVDLVLASTSWAPLALPT